MADDEFNGRWRGDVVDPNSRCWYGECARLPTLLQGLLRSILTTITIMDLRVMIIISGQTLLNKFGLEVAS